MNSLIHAFYECLHAYYALVLFLALAQSSEKISSSPYCTRLETCWVGATCIPFSLTQNLSEHKGITKILLKYL